MDNLLETFNDKASQDSFEASDVQSYKIHAIVPYLLPILFFVPLLGNKNSAFCRFHANQQLAWLITAAILGVVLGIIGFIPILGKIIGVLGGIILIAIGVCLAIGAHKGMAVKVPFVGELLKLF